MQALSQKDLPEAANLLAQMKSDDPLSVETRGLELEYLICAGRLDDASQLAAQLVDCFPNSARIHFLSGKLAYQLRDYARAEAMLSESYQLSPHWASRRYLGKALTQAGRFDEAESILIALVWESPWCHLDLAWLYERKGQVERALKHAESFLQCFPDNSYAREQKSRLEGRLLEPDQFVQDCEGMLELGEEVPDHFVPQYVENLIRTGQADRARQFLSSHGTKLDSRAATRVGWACYGLQVYDLACEMFLLTAETNRAQPKFLSALEAAATRCGRLSDLMPLYQRWAQDEPRYFGRLHRISRRIGS
jgi:tetratricopeptide (TPR) repeat protein